MTMPFGYVSPEQVMKDRADYARKGIARGRSVVVIAYDGGILFVAENLSRALHKISEIYDRIAFAAVGKYNEFENLRMAGVRYADLRGYSYDRQDVTGRGLANVFAQTLGTIFTVESKPYEVEIVIAEVGETADDDQIYRLTYDGSVADEHGFVAMGGSGEQITQALQERYRDGMPLQEALATAVELLGRDPATGDQRSLTATQLEVAVLDRARPRRKFRRLSAATLAGCSGSRWRAGPAATARRARELAADLAGRRLARAARPRRRVVGRRVTAEPAGPRVAQPWELLSERPRTDGWVPVVTRTYRMPDGSVSEWDVHDPSFQTVAVLALTERRPGTKVVLVRQFRPGPGEVLVGASRRHRRRRRRAGGGGSPRAARGDRLPGGRRRGRRWLVGVRCIDLAAYGRDRPRLHPRRRPHVVGRRRVLRATPGHPGRAACGRPRRSQQRRRPGLPRTGRRRAAVNGSSASA